MKRIIFTIAILFAGMSFSCKKYLDVQPRSRIKASNLLTTQTGFSDALTGVYTKMSQQNLYGDKLTMSFLEVLAQRYKIGSQLSPYYFWSIYDYNAAKTKPVVSSIWSEAYSCIVNLNNILETIDAKKNVFSGPNFGIVKGEALGLRAFLHFDLLRMFGPVYSANPTAASIPFRNKVSIDGMQPLPANMLIDSVVADLKKAEQLLAVDPILGKEESELIEFSKDQRKYRFNLLAVQATLARVYLYAGNKPDAYSYAMKVINSGLYNFVTDADISQSGVCKDRLFRNELLFSLYIADMKPYTDTYFITTDPGSFENSALSNTDENIETLFEHSGTDYRRQYLWEAGSLGKLTSVKYQQFTSTTVGNCTWPKNLVPLLRISEMFYIAAECSSSLTESKNLLNEVLTHRGLSALDLINTDAELQDILTKEYQKEFYAEGQLMFYYKRKNVSQIPGASNGVDSRALVFPIPDDELAFQTSK